MQRIGVIDSHTAGEPTRLVMSGFPSLPGTTMTEKLDALRMQHDRWRRTCLLEPRGHDVLVGALYCEPVTPTAACGVIFFNNVGYLGMCGHGMIGLITSLQHLGMIRPGEHSIDTPVGAVHAVLHDDGTVTVRNVRSYRYRKQIAVNVPGYRCVVGDIAWGGNWFFLISDHGHRLDLNNIERLTDFGWSTLKALHDQGIRGAHGAVIDHVELFADDELADSRNFVMCPGKSYDRSPCGTGTSAKMACLAADGMLSPGHPWVQAGIAGCCFEGRYQWEGDQIRPLITGRAHITSETSLLIDDRDPFAWGICVAPTLP